MENGESKLPQKEVDASVAPHETTTSKRRSENKAKEFEKIER